MWLQLPVPEMQGPHTSKQICVLPCLREADSNNFYNHYKRIANEEENEEDEEAEAIMEQCDDMFYENEEEINHALEEYFCMLDGKFFLQKQVLPYGEQTNLLFLLL